MCNINHEFFIWEEKNLIEPQTNCEQCVEQDKNDSTKNIKIDSMKNQCNDIGRKKCSKCGIEKELQEFNRYKKGKFGRHSICKKCQAINKKPTDKNKVKLYNKKYYEKNKKSLSLVYKKYVSNNREKTKKYQKQYRIINKEFIKNNRQKHYIKNKRKILETNRKYHNHRRKCDLNFKLICNARSSIYRIIKGKKSKRTLEYLGCSRDELKLYLESKFKQGMNWNNYGKFGWHIDHIIPISSAKSENDIIKLCNYTNLHRLK